MGYVPKVLPTPFRAQVIVLSTLSPSMGSQELSLLCPIRALRVYIERSASYRKSEQLFVGFGNCTKGGPVMKQGISRWLVYVITLAYSSLYLQCPIGVRAHSTRGIASSWTWSSEVSISEICEAPGWTTWTSLPYRSESFLLKLAILWVHLTNIVQAPPSLGLSILYGRQVSTLRDDTQATDDPMAQPVLGVFSWLPWVLLTCESWFWVIPHHSTAWLYLFPYSAVRVKYQMGMYSVTIVTLVPWDIEQILRSWPCYELYASVASFEEIWDAAAKRLLI